MTISISPLAPSSYPNLPEIAGVSLAVAETNIRYKNRPDLLLVSFAEGTNVAGVFTSSFTKAAPVSWCEEALRNGTARALIVNAGNANAFTGKFGMESVERIVSATAKTLKCSDKEVFIASTGVIGEPLNDNKIIEFIPELHKNLSANAWQKAASAIMTTDTFMKVATVTSKIGKDKVTINGFAKGSGMIAPNMATMLGFVFTDAKIPAPILQQVVSNANQVSFNSITVDGDTSTNDTLIAFATGKAAHAEINSINDADLRQFIADFTDVMTSLATQIVKDGEGANKFITIKASGAENNTAARNIALTVANSPLVKTAIAASDANWGRIIAAIGRAGEKIAQEKLELRIGGIAITKAGARIANYDETPVAAHMKGYNIDIDIEIGLGEGNATIYTCDLTHGYIDINGSYRS